MRATGARLNWPAIVPAPFPPHALRPPVRPTLLIIGCGDVGLRVAQQLQGRLRILALTSQPARGAELRAAGITPLVGNLDQPASLQRLAGLADWVLHLAPPAAGGERDLRTTHLLQALMRRRLPRVLVYASTSGVYGDCAGEWVDETRSVAPATARARRRVDAEAQVRAFGRASGVHVAVLRIPGIYAMNRVGGDPRQRLARGTPVLAAVDDVYTNHIHADDLARACIAALARAAPQRVFNVCDDSQLRMGDYFDLVARLHGLAAPPRISRAQALAEMPAMSLSFMSESRRLRNTRMKRELRLRLRYATVAQGLGVR